MKTWPDLAHRARIAARKLPTEEDPAIAGIKDVLAKWKKMLDDEDAMNEDQYCAHLKTCAHCRAEVASAVRKGAKLSSRILAAAGVEVLN